jgi:glutamine---fructose-6-phosphate transaminase (isomerizing)
VAGELFRREIHEQPAALRDLLAAGDEMLEIGRRVAERPRLVRLVAHGSSDNAASFAVYAFGLLAGWTAMRDSISLSVYYGARLAFDDALVVALSQSGRTPDVVEYVERARAGGALTLALTNDVDSPLAATSELTLPLHAPEQAVAATKSYANELAALALLAGSAAGRERMVAEALARTADVVEAALPEVDAAVQPLADALAAVERMVVIGRGVEYATAREVALKLTETCRVAADALTATDLAHGPVAALDSQFPVWTIASEDAVLPAVEAAVERAHQAGALIVASGSAAGEIRAAVHRVVTPSAPLPLLAPIVSVLPGQLFALALARAKGLDPDRPEQLTKVTLAP